VLVTIDRPDRLNVMTMTMLIELEQSGWHLRPLIYLRLPPTK
jgi:hypothetical protein